MHLQIRRRLISQLTLPPRLKLYRLLTNYAHLGPQESVEYILNNWRLGRLLFFVVDSDNLQSMGLLTKIGRLELFFHFTTGREAGTTVATIEDHTIIRSGQGLWACFPVRDQGPSPATPSQGAEWVYSPSVNDWPHCNVEDDSIN